MTKSDIINKIKSLFKEYERDDFGFFYGRSFPITHNYITYDVLDIVDDEEDGIIVNCVSRSNFGLRQLYLNDLSTKTINKILNKIEESLEE